MITDAQIRQMFPNAGVRLEPHLAYIGPAMQAGGITTPRRIAAFLAQLAEESGEYRYMRELASGAEYEGRVDLGNIHPGDGVKYAGEGPEQVTGHDNITACGKALGIDAENDPALLQLPKYATASAVWFWNSGSDLSLSLLADRDWFRLITRKINGGYNGLASRVMYWNRNRTILGLPAVNLDLELGSIMEFQRAQGLRDIDGIVGPATIAALKREKAAA